MAQNVEYIISLRDNFSPKLSKINASMQKLGSRMKSVGKTLSLTLTAPIVAAGVLAIKMGADFEEAMTKIETLVGINVKVVKGFEESIKSIAAETGRSSTELAKALFSVTSAGLRGEQAIKVLNLSAKASAVGLGETQLVAKALTGVLQSYSRQGLTAARATDILTAIVREGNLAAEDLAPTLGRVTGIASELGVSFEEVGASIATFTRLGISTEEAVVGLRGIFNSLLKPTADAEKRFNEIGLTTEKLRQMLGKEGLQKTLALLVGKFKGNTEALADMFPNVRALSAVLGTAGAQGETYAQVIDNIINSQGILNEAFKVTSETAAFKMNKAFTSMKNTLKSFGLIALKGLTPFFEILSKIIKRINDMPKPVKKTIIVITGLVAALGPLLIALGFLMTTVIPGLITAFAFLSAVIAANPIGILVTVIGLAVAGFLLFRKSGEKITKMQQKLNKITKKFSNLLVEEKSKASLLFSQLKNTNKGTAERSRLIKEINSKYGKFLKNHIKEKDSLLEINIAQNEVIDGIKRRIAAKIIEAKQIEIFTAQFERENKFLSKFNELREKEFATLLRGPLKDIEILIEAFNEVGGASQDAFNMVNAAIESTKIADKKNLEALLQLAVQRKRDAASIEKQSKRAKLIVGEFGEQITQGLREGMEAAGITKVVSAAPKVFNISIENLVETINNNVTNLKEGMNESKKIITEALLAALSDVQVNVR